MKLWYFQTNYSTALHKSPNLLLRTFRIFDVRIIDVLLYFLIGGFLVAPLISSLDPWRVDRSWRNETWSCRDLIILGLVSVHSVVHCRNLLDLWIVELGVLTTIKLCTVFVVFWKVLHYWVKKGLVFIKQI